MQSSIFCSTAPIGKGHGGGIVSYHEVMALKETTNLVKILCPKSEELGVPTEIINLNGQYPDNPFMWDYLSSIRASHADIAFFNGAPFSSTVRAINPGKVIVDIPAHNLELSIEEFERQIGEYPFKHMQDPFLWELYTDFIRNADIVVCPSKMSAEYVKKNPGINGRAVVIPHGCDLPEVTPIPSEFRVGYLGATGPDKGVTYLLKAWAGLMYRDSELVLRTDLVDTSIFTKNQRIKRLDYIENISDFYNQISVYVQPSVTEGFGIPCLEAMSHGRPVIVTEGAGVSELVKDGVEGYVVPIRNPGAIADRIDYLKTHPNKIVEMSKKVRLKAEQYAWDRAKKSFKDVILENIS